MSEQFHAQLSRAAPPSAEPEAAPNAPLPAAPGTSLRLDASHAELPPEGDGAPIDSSAGGPDGAPRDAGDERVELQSSQIVAQLQKRHAELDRREHRLHAQLAQFDQERREARLWASNLEAALEEREFAISRQEAALAQRAESCLKLESELKALHETLLRERHSLNAEREQFIVDREQDRRDLEEVQSQKRHELERQHHDFLAEQERLRLELQQERVLLDNRHHFQREHLRRSMQEFEVAQAEFRREQQSGRTRLEELERQNLLRGRQLDRLRELVEERQASIDRERGVLLKERRAMDERLRADAEGLARDRAQWEQEREVQRADLRRQHDMLAVHADSLETRRQRLDRLRTELEETNRQTLEMRVAVEESYAQLTQTSGAEATKRRVEEARAILAEYYRHTRDSLLQQRQELEQAHAKLAEQRNEFLQERQTLVDWIALQEEQIARREQELNTARNELDGREQTWRTAADRWTREKLEAEAVIRDLLRQLAEREAGADVGQMESS
ncbi:MAG: hypothetical protein ACT4QC_14415 [Planctomycetaceae bacterium]